MLARNTRRTYTNDEVAIRMRYFVRLYQTIYILDIYSTLCTIGLYLVKCIVVVHVRTFITFRIMSVYKAAVQRKIYRLREVERYLVFSLTVLYPRIQRYTPIVKRVSGALKVKSVNRPRQQKINIMISQVELVKYGYLFTILRTILVKINVKRAYRPKVLIRVVNVTSRHATRVTRVVSSGVRLFTSCQIRSIRRLGMIVRAIAVNVYGTEVTHYRPEYTYRVRCDESVYMTQYCGTIGSIANAVTVSFDYVRQRNMKRLPIFCRYQPIGSYRLLKRTRHRNITYRTMCVFVLRHYRFPIRITWSIVMNVGIPYAVLGLLMLCITCYASRVLLVILRTVTIRVRITCDGTVHCGVTVFVKSRSNFTTVYRRLVLSTRKIRVNSIRATTNVLELLTTV